MRRFEKGIPIEYSKEILNLRCSVSVYTFHSTKTEINDSLKL